MGVQLILSEASPSSILKERTIAKGGSPTENALALEDVEHSIMRSKLTPPTDDSYLR